MTERITPAMVTATTLNDINSSLASLERTSDELSSGKTILEPSDNPYGASQVIDLQSQLDGLSSYATNAQEGISWENTAGGAMANISNVLQTVRELLVQSSTGTENQSDRESIATEVDQLTEAVKQDANTQYAGQYVFSGTDTTTEPYPQGAEDTYQGNTGTITRAIGPGVSVDISTNISSLLGNGQASGDGKLLDTLRTISEHLRGGTTEDISALGSSDLKSLESSIDTLSQLQASAGSVTDQLQTATSRIESLQGSITASLANTDSANIAETSIAYSSAARRCEHRPRIPTPVPAVARRGESELVCDIPEHPFRRGAGRRGGRDRVSLRFDRAWGIALHAARPQPGYRLLVAALGRRAGACAAGRASRAVLLGVLFAHGARGRRADRHRRGGAGRQAVRHRARHAQPARHHSQPARAACDPRGTRISGDQRQPRGPAAGPIVRALRRDDANSLII
jgi:flagellar hook-associated protein 3 FlgL